MSDKLVKEIITTTTERFGDNGSIKEKVTESREKIYEYGYTDKQIAEAEVVDKTPPKEAVPQADLISQAAQNIDKTAKSPSQAQQESPSGLPTYNRIPMPPPVQAQQSTPGQTTFPWEQPR